MKVFDFDPRDYTRDYTRDRWALIPKGVTPEFHAAVARTALVAANADKFAIAGKKEQAVFELTLEQADECFDAICALCGLDRDTVVLSERHLQTYDQHADPGPPAHKDRRSSQVSVGLAINIPEGSSLLVWPTGDCVPNLGDKAMYCDAADVAGTAVELFDHERDVVVFEGSSTWHLRQRSAGTVNLYLKFNDFGHDPLGEDPRKG